MEDVAFFELMGGGAQQVLAGHIPHRRHQGHPVLELVAETEGPAGLIESRPGQHPAGQRLIEQPLIDHQVEGAIGSLHPQGSEDVVPAGRDLGLDVLRVGLPVPLDEGARFRRSSRPCPSRKVTSIS